MANYQLAEFGGFKVLIRLPRRDCLMVFVHVIVTLARLARPGGLRVLNRGRKRAPNLRAADRILAGLCTLSMCPARVLRSAIVLKPSTLLHLHSV